MPSPPSRSSTRTRVHPVGLDRMRVNGAAVRAATYVPALIATLGIPVLLALTLRRGVEVPFWDEWEWADLVYAAHRHTLTFGQLWSLHNEHRVFVPNLLMLALDAVGGWSVVREQVVSLVLLALTQLFVWLLIRRNVPIGRCGFCFLAATALVLGLSQYENLEWGFQLAWFMCDLCMVAAVWLLTGARAPARALLLAMLAATIASMSSSQGLLIWPAGLLAIALLPRRRLGRAAAWIAVGAVVTVVVRAGASGAVAGQAGLGHPVLLLKYALTYLGGPLAHSHGIAASMFAGAVLSVVLGAIGVAALRARASRFVRLVPWVAIAAYAVLNALLTAFGRAGFGLGQATSSRYTSIAELGWVAALAATCILLPRGTALRFVSAAAVALVVLVFSLRESRHGDLAWRQHTVAMREGRAAIATGDPRALSALYPGPQRLAVLLGELARVRDGVFAPSAP